LAPREVLAYTGAMKLLRLMFFVLALVPVFASAQWQWIDKDGRKVFSDRSPPSDIPAKNILKQPGVRSSAPAEEPAAAASSVAKAAVPAPKVSGKDKELEDKKKAGESAEAEKKKAHDEEVAKVRAGNCDRAKRSKAAFDSGARITRTDMKGEKVYLDDNERASEAKRNEAVIASDCGPAPQ
jgi:hypothetical protein